MVKDMEQEHSGLKITRCLILVNGVWVKGMERYMKCGSITSFVVSHNELNFFKQHSQLA